MFIRILYILIVCWIANFLSLSTMIPLPTYVFPILLSGFICLQLFPSASAFRLSTWKLRISSWGSDLLKIFLISLSLSILYSILGWLGIFSVGSLIANPKLWLFNSLFIFLAEALTFWNGIIRIYLTSTQLGIKWRIIGIACGMIPVVNVIVLAKLLHVVDLEVKVEHEKIVCNNERREMQICKTKYPILLVHGVFFRDSAKFNYWGRVPHELEINGATLYYGNHPSASSVEDSAGELDARIRQIVSETGCEKVNIIAHSKGGLDCRYALSELGTDQFVASLTTINTPHRGCEFANYLLTKIPTEQQNKIAGAYNLALRQIGDENPDFIAAVHSLTSTSCQKLNQTIHDQPTVYYQSFGSTLKHATGGRFPLNLTFHFVKSFDGANDGLVGEESFPWGDDFTMISSKGKRGISHADMIDLNRENFPDFDVREFYVELVQNLGKKGF